MSTIFDERVSTNGHHAPADLADLPDAPDIPFGDKDHQTVMPVVASIMLTRLREKDLRLFGELLCYAMTGEEIDLHTTSRGRNARRPANVSQ